MMSRKWNINNKPKLVPGCLGNLSNTVKTLMNVLMHCNWCFKHRLVGWMHRTHLGDRHTIHLHTHRDTGHTETHFCFPAALHLIEVNIHAEFRAISTTDGKRHLRTETGRLVCLFITEWVLWALITCIALPPGSGTTAADSRLTRRQTKLLKQGRLAWVITLDGRWWSRMGSFGKENTLRFWSGLKIWVFAWAWRSYWS